MDKPKPKATTVFNWQDPLLLTNELTTAEQAIVDSTRQFCQQDLLPKVNDAFQKERNDPSVMAKMGEVGILGLLAPESLGGSGAGYVSYGLAAREIERIDSGYRSMASVQMSLVIYPILAYGSEAQQQKYIPDLVAGQKIGCFGLTEAESGSDPASMRTTACKAGNGYELNGSKLWITNAPVADVFVIWAKVIDEDNTIRGFIIDRDTPGLSVNAIKGKLSLRTSATGEILLNNVHLTADALLPNVTGLKGPFGCLNRARYGISWGSMGAAEDCWHRAREYGLERKQFSRPLANTQLFQQKLVDMQTEITLGLYAALRLGRLMDQNQLMPEAISLLKRNSGKALNIARNARDMLGANGIDIGYHVMRHMVNLETVNTYEGTYDIHTLILGRAQTGLQAFS